jgi:repressor LexA
MLPRTQRQKEILDYITRFQERHGYIPSYAQIARQFGVKSRATIAKHIAALERRGLLVREHEDGSFALNVKVEDKSSDSLCEVKLLGRIAAGAPLEVVDYEERIPVPRFLLGRVKPDRVYALRVKGDSMIDEHICDGDIALIENRTDARDGEIVVALLIEENQATLKQPARSACKASSAACSGRVTSFTQSRKDLAKVAISLRLCEIFAPLRETGFKTLVAEVIAEANSQQGSAPRALLGEAYTRVASATIDSQNCDAAAFHARGSNYLSQPRAELTDLQATVPR